MNQVQICSVKELQWLLRNKKVDLDGSIAIISSSYPLTIGELSLMRHSFQMYDDIDFDCLGRCLSPEAANIFAKDIKRFADIPNWYFVCDGGCRRSAAIACATLRFWGREKEELEIWRNPRKEPNIWVFTLMADALGVPINDVDLDLRIHMNRTAIRSAFRNTSTV